MYEFLPLVIHGILVFTVLCDASCYVCGPEIGCMVSRHVRCTDHFLHNIQIIYRAKISLSVSITGLDPHRMKVI
jgi:hypothetical protein